jgi:uncharacterized protein YjiS (DUF1127 family)
MTNTIQFPAKLAAVPAPRRTIWQRVGSTIVLAIKTVWEAWCRRESIRALNELDDRMLADIGISRSGIEAAVRGDPTFASHAKRSKKPTPELRKAA